MRRWPACSTGAIRRAAGKLKVMLPGDVAIDAEVDPGTNGDGDGLAARLDVSLPGSDYVPG